MKKIRLTIFILLVLPMSLFSNPNDKPGIVIGSKKFTESVILGEIVTLLVESSGQEAIHRRELGGTRILWKALTTGELDIYPEYTGTIIREIFAGKEIDEDELANELQKYGILMSRPLGFNNTYAIGMKEEVAHNLNITKLSDLRNHPRLKFGFTNEFMDRGDGWPGLRNYYSLPQKDVRGLDHDLAYRGLENGSIQVIDMYSTDAEIAYYHLRSLADDKNFFPDYKAVLLIRADLKEKAPTVLHALQKLAGAISEKEMIKLNAEVKIDRHPENQVAASFLQKKFDISPTLKKETLFQRFWKHTVEHLILVLISLSAAVFVAIPLGLIAAKKEKLGQVILGVVGIIQTIPSLALLVFMIPLLGIGGAPAIVALFLYSLLPIVRNTHSGMRNIDPALKESALALGLPSIAILRLVELPLAAGSILAGVKTSAVINIGTATLGALIGAGGYGQPILTGIRLDDVGLILQGAVPAAVLALLVQGGFDLLEKWIVPKGLRIKSVE